jgi:hypothetical protein
VVLDDVGSTSAEWLTHLERKRQCSPSSPRSRSPPRWAGQRGRSERKSEVIVERIVERTVPAGTS